MKNIKDLLNQIKEDLEQEASDFVLDFVSDYEASDSVYLCDAFTEFADNNTSIYYCDQRAYYNEHAQECEDSLTMLYSGEDLAQLIKERGLDGLICYAGAVGEYEAIYRELSDNEETIKKLLVVRYLLKHDLFTLSEQDIDTLLNDVSVANIDRLSDLEDMIKEKTESEGE